MDEIMEKMLPSDQVVIAISRIPDQHLQNLVMQYFSRYENAAWTAMFEARDRIANLVDAMDSIHAISAQGLAEGNQEASLLEIYNLSKEFQENPREELMTSEPRQF